MTMTQDKPDGSAWVDRALRRGGHLQRVQPRLHPERRGSFQTPNGASRSGAAEGAQPQSPPNGKATRFGAHKKMATIWGLALITAGLASLTASLVRSSAWAEAGISIGTGGVMAGFVLLLEPRLVRDVGKAAGTAATATAEQTATEVATRLVDGSTTEMRERIEHLEGLRELQQRLEAGREAATTELIKKVSEQPDFESTARLLRQAGDKDLFGDLQLRSGDDTTTLVNLTLTSWNWEDDAIRLAISPFDIEGDPAQIEWQYGVTIGEAWGACLDACERKAVPTSGIDLAAVFKSLASSYNAMIQARRSAADSPGRLQGRLRLLVNDEWAVTDMGLESRISSFHLPWYPDETHACPRDHDEALWEEAIFYAPLWLDPVSDSRTNSDEPF